jgi:hypothetical protein
MRSVKLTEKGAIDNLNQLFGDSEHTFISIEGIFATAGRQGSLKDRAWLYNKLSDMRPYDLFSKTYEVSFGRKRLAGIRLTAKGRRARMKYADSASTKLPLKWAAEREVTFEDVRADVEVLKARFPGLNISFTVELK